MKTKRSISLLSILMIIVFTSCGGATPTSGIQQYPETKHLYKEKESYVQVSETKPKIKKLSNLNVHQIIWSGKGYKDVDNDTLLKSY